jgi:hypothetical protein
MKKFLFIALFHFLFTNGQSYTITPKSSNSNGTTYEVKQNGTGAYQNPKSYTPTTTSVIQYVSTNGASWFCLLREWGF